LVLKAAGLALTEATRDWFTYWRRRMFAAVGRMDPNTVVALGYATYIFLGFLALSLPWAQATATPWLHRLFMAVSTVTTTGLAPHDPGSTYTVLGELALLAMMPVGALGYLTLGTFVAVSLSDRMGKRRMEIARATFGFPEGIDMKRLVKQVVIFTFAIQTIGAVALYPQFLAAGVENPLWMAVFHAVSAFCTAGVALFATSFEGFRDQPLLLMTVAGLAWCGALGFLVLSEFVDAARGRRKGLGFTSRVALLITGLYTVICTFILLAVEPSIRALPAQDQLWNAIFMVMSAGTTVGFNSVPVSTLAPAVVVIMYLIMVFGASPGGTGGGLKSSTFAIMAALVVSTLRRRSRVTLLGLEILPDKVQQATASVAFYSLLIGAAIFALLLTETAPFDQVLFEAISSLSGIGMSMGLTPALSDAGMVIAMGLMFIGRVGILAFGIAIATRDPRDHDPEDADVVL
jgi:trk system potassium uptake protein TrkH